MISTNLSIGSVCKEVDHQKLAVLSMRPPGASGAIYKKPLPAGQIVLRRLELNLSGELQLARRQLVGDTGERRSKTDAGSCAISVCAAEADDVAMVQDVESLGAQVHVETVACERNSLAYKGRNIVDGRAAARVAANHRAIDDRPVGGCAGIAAVVHTGHDVIRKAAGERRNSSQ